MGHAPQHHAHAVAAVRELFNDAPLFIGRLDLSFGGNGPAKLLEYNADTPTSIFETAVFQWSWLEDAKASDPVCTYETVVCKACTRLHFINRQTRKLLGDQDN